VTSLYLSELFQVINPSEWIEIELIFNGNERRFSHYSQVDLVCASVRTPVSQAPLSKSLSPQPSFPSRPSFASHPKFVTYSVYKYTFRDGTSSSILSISNIILQHTSKISQHRFPKFPVRQSSSTQTPRQLSLLNVSIYLQHSVQQVLFLELRLSPLSIYHNHTASIAFRRLTHHL
jgi:hypothetical protein